MQDCSTSKSYNLMLLSACMARHFCADIEFEFLNRQKNSSSWVVRCFLLGPGAQQSVSGIRPACAFPVLFGLFFGPNIPALARFRPLPGGGGVGGPSSLTDVATVVAAASVVLVTLSHPSFSNSSLMSACCEGMVGSRIYSSPATSSGACWRSPDRGFADIRDQNDAICCQVRYSDG